VLQDLPPIEEERDLHDQEMTKENLEFNETKSFIINDNQSMKSI